jgi:hypothetical protein
MYVFVSYQTNDRVHAGRVKTLLEHMGVSSFLAHEDIEVSEEWRKKMLKELEKIDIFIALLSERYFRSPWCSQELGIAAFRNVTIIPLSLDGTTPVGFGSHIQSRRLRGAKIENVDLIAGMIRHDKPNAIELMIDLVANSASFDEANQNFDLLQPYLSDASRPQKLRLLESVSDNNQVRGAYRAKEYLKPMLSEKQLLIPNRLRQYLETIWN